MYVYTYRSTLLCFDALSRLTMDHITRQRRKEKLAYLYICMYLLSSIRCSIYSITLKDNNIEEERKLSALLEFCHQVL